MLRSPDVARDGHGGSLYALGEALYRDLVEMTSSGEPLHETVVFGLDARRVLLLHFADLESRLWNIQFWKECAMTTSKSDVNTSVGDGNACIIVSTEVLLRFRQAHRKTWHWRLLEANHGNLTRYYFSQNGTYSFHYIL